MRKVSGPFEGVLPAALSALELPTLNRLNLDLQTLIVLLKADETAAALPLSDL